MTPPSHHHPDGGFRAPWLDGEGPRFRDFLRWRWERLVAPRPPAPDEDEIPREEPDPARPAAAPEELRLTWLGHSAFLVQVGGVNLLTDPALGGRASPFPWMGPKRLVPAPLGVTDLPPVHAVLLSHDHFDHLDLPTVRALRERFGDALEWITPLGYRSWFQDLGIGRVTELDWWEATAVRAGGGKVMVRALPAQHWTRRGWKVNTRLWASFGIRAPAGPSVYFGGDSGYFGGFRDILKRDGSFDALLMPVGAYEPRWFMRTAHMNPEEAVQAYLDLGGDGTFVGMHWGTFVLTDEPVLEPPERTRAAWAGAGLPPERLHLPGIGGTVRIGPAQGRDDALR